MEGVEQTKLGENSPQPPNGGGLVINGTLIQPPLPGHYFKQAKAVQGVAVGLLMNLEPGRTAPANVFAYDSTGGFLWRIEMAGEPGEHVVDFKDMGNLAVVTSKAAEFEVCLKTGQTKRAGLA